MFEKEQTVSAARYAGSARLKGQRSGQPCSDSDAHHVVVDAPTVGPERPQRDGRDNCERRSRAGDPSAVRGHGPGATTMTTH